MVTQFLSENQSYARPEFAAELSLQQVNKTDGTIAMAQLRSQKQSGTWQRFALAFLALALTGCVAMTEGTASPSASTALSKVQQQPLKERQRIAAEMFRDRCKNAGVFIRKTVDDVEGVFLMKLRPEDHNFENQYLLDDPYGRDASGYGLIETFLKDFYESWPELSEGRTSPPTDRQGYKYVEIIDPKDGLRYRYTGAVKAVGKMDVSAPNVQLELRRDKNFDLNIYKFVLEKAPAKGPALRYGVTYEDISTPEERDYWIAASSLKVVDLKTNEIIAERIGYMVDWAQGVRVGGRAPWLLAADNACPEFAPRHGAVSQLYQTIRFVNKSLKPKKD